MHTVKQCIVLLACTIMCTSAVIKDCKCINTRKAVKQDLIANVKEYGPRPYCNKKEVIVTLKDNSLHCLDPKTRFTQAVLQRDRRQKARAMMNNSRPKTTTETAVEVATETATVLPTSTNIILK